MQHAVLPYLVADFDLDDRDDLLIPDHGFDAPPFPGARNWLLMNTAPGLLDTTAGSLSLAKTFTHGASVGDVNNNGYPDIFFNNNNRDSTFEERLWFNNGDATFTKSGSNL